MRSNMSELKAPSSDAGAPSLPPVPAGLPAGCRFLRRRFCGVPAGCSQVADLRRLARLYAWRFVGLLRAAIAALVLLPAVRQRDGGRDWCRWASLSR